MVNFRDQVVAPTPASDQSSQRAGVLTAAVDATVPTATAIAASGLEVGTSDPAKRAGTLGSSAEVSSAISIYPTAKDTQRMMRVGCFRDDERDRYGSLVLREKGRRENAGSGATRFVDPVDLPFFADSNWCNRGLCEENRATCRGGTFVFAYRRRR